MSTAEQTQGEREANAWKAGAVGSSRKFGDHQEQDVPHLWL